MVEYSGSSEAAPVVRIERRFDAPVSKVYRAWLDPELLSRWMAPADYLVSKVDVDERLGGHFRIWQVAPDGQEGGFDADIVEIEPERRLVFAWRFVGPQRMEGPYFDTRMTITFEEAGEGATLLTLVHERLEDLQSELPDVAGSVEFGWNSALDKLPESL